MTMHRVNRWRQSRGFTLIEIMVVIMITAVLLSIAIPNVVRARDKAREKTCIANMRHIADAKDQFALQNGKNIGDAVAWADLVPDYLKIQPNCPSGGAYNPLAVGDTVDCSEPGHEL